MQYITGVAFMAHITESLRDQVCIRLEELIDCGHFRPMNGYMSKFLSRHLSLSRTNVREALLKLGGAGLGFLQELSKLQVALSQRPPTFRKSTDPGNSRGG